MSDSTQETLALMQISLGLSMGHMCFSNFSDQKFPVDVPQIAKKFGIVCKTTVSAKARFAHDSEQGVIETAVGEGEKFTRFVQAHMLGRHVLKLGDVDYQDSEAFSAKSNNIDYQQANAFAMGLLMPYNEFRQVIRSGKMKNAEQLSEVFGVSPVAIAQRVEQMNLLVDSDY